MKTNSLPWRGGKHPPRRAAALLAGAALLAVGAALGGRHLPYAGDRGHAARLHYIVDGDTIHVRMQGRLEKVRLLGIDTPEMRDNPKARRDARREGIPLSRLFRRGRAARDYLRRLLPRRAVLRIEPGRRPRDDYGRLLAYVFLPDGTLLNEAVLYAGWGDVMLWDEDTRYRHRLIAARDQARSAGRGLWGPAWNDE